MSADGKCPLSIVDMLLNDTATLDVFDKPVADDDAERAMNWDLGNDNFLDSLLKMENLNDSAPFEFLSSNEDFMSSAATTPRSYDNAESSSCSDSGLSSVDNMPFNPISESSKSDDAVTKMEFTYDSFVKEEIVDIDDEVVIDDDTTQENIEETNDKDNNILEENPTIIQQPQLLKTTPRTVVISPKQSKGPIAISKNLSKPVFIPINLSNVKTIKVVNQNGKTINADAFRRLQSINNGRRIFVRNNGSMVSKSMPALKQTKVVMSDCTSDESDSMYPRLHLSNEERKLMEKEGIKLPSHYPLTKHEERDLKRIRRKIRNKISAQDSRKRKKEYVDGLEERVKLCSDENSKLLKNVNTLQTENERLKAALKRLQNVIAPGGTTAQPATCLLVLMMSLALIAAPNLRPTVTDEKDVLSIEGQESNTAVPGRSRNLLFSKSGSPLSTTNLKDMLNMVANGSSADGQSDTIMAELGELLDFNNLARNKDHDYSRTSMDDYYIPESDDGWTKAEKRPAPSEWFDELITPAVKSKLDSKRVILLSSDEESY
ncbi:cyclic AMP-responsive element-binding protein 3-like protein 2 [Myzus persicae]|uniref:cyclic AMP-responsive element-binding protein 3-like protein 2 n=1 Tax=Myzus persicae TaxID=13164 RepID=UPI000B93907F|nr:cyclic AMP-responsive element-binding protein 3-like protein 2 [Myzus persicae]